MKKYSKKDEKFLTETFLELRDITATAKEYAEYKEKDYNDSVRRAVSSVLKRLGVTSKVKGLENSKEFLEAKDKKIQKDKSIFFITWAQNQTSVNKKLLKNMEAYAKEVGAQILVIAGRYENPTSFSNPDKVKSKETWSKKILPYLTANRHNVHKHVEILADIKINPTATYPLTGLQDVGGEKTTIIGHPKMHLQSLPVLEGRPNQIVMTTGAITHSNYSDTKAGAKGDSKHKLGFAVLEIADDDSFYIRQVESLKNGSFIDLNYSVKGGKVEEVSSCKALIMGDSHNRWLDEEVHDTRMNKLCKKIKPEYIIQHDIQDNDAVNHHEEKDPIKKYQRYQEDRHLVSKELEETYSFLEQFIEDYKVVVVRSNHDLWLDKWLSMGDWKKDIPNAREYMEWALIKLQGKAPKGILPYLIDQKFEGRVRTLDRDESFIIGGYELAHHGDLGANGSRGNIRQFDKMSTPVIVGDSHTPSRVNDALQVGTATYKRLGYNIGASSWLNCDAIVHLNNKAQHIIYINNNFTTLF